jgi:pimeloyl-ACP methyl ester carboxylesterase
MVDWVLQAQPDILDKTTFQPDIAPGRRLAELIDNAAGPALLLHGTLDVHPVEYSQRGAARRADFEFVPLPGSGHAPHLCRPGRVVREIDRFLGIGGTAHE